MKNLGMIVVFVGLASCKSWDDGAIEDAGLVEVIDAGTVAVDVGTTDVGDPSWIPCPQAWPPSLPIVYCGVASGISCYEFPSHTLCRGTDYVVLMPIGDVDCAACAAIGVSR